VRTIPSFRSPVELFNRLRLYVIDNCDTGISPAPQHSLGNDALH
jgi:hypothetical protein